MSDKNKKFSHNSSKPAATEKSSLGSFMKKDATPVASGSRNDANAQKSNNQSGHQSSQHGQNKVGAPAQSNHQSPGHKNNQKNGAESACKDNTCDASGSNKKNNR